VTPTARLASSNRRKKAPARSVDFGDRIPGPGHSRAGGLIAGVALVAVAFAGVGIDRALADEGGVGFWLPGQLGSLAAVPQTPGWNVGIIDYYTSVTGGGNVAAARQVTIGKLPQNVTVNLDANLHANGELGVFSPGYVFATPILGGQLAVSMAAIGAVSAPTSTGC
jgi:hypothetical protein